MQLYNLPHQFPDMLSRSSKSSTMSRSFSSVERDTTPSGLILSLRLGKKHRKTMSFTFNSDATNSPLFYVQIATNSIKMMNINAHSRHKPCRMLSVPIIGRVNRPPPSYLTASDDSTEGPLCRYVAGPHSTSMLVGLGSIVGEELLTEVKDGKRAGNAS